MGLAVVGTAGSVGQVGLYIGGLVDAKGGGEPDFVAPSLSCGLDMGTGFRFWYP